MRVTNRLAVEYLLKNGYDNIWLKSHTKFKDVVYTKTGSFRATDLWNLFDGICTGFGYIYFIQIKTNAWPVEKPIIEFVENTNSKAMALNAKKKSNGRYEITERRYPKWPTPF
jgi:hypothetical protein